MRWLTKLLSTPSSDPLALELNPILGFTPGKIEYYHQAFCHSSIEEPKYGDNERLEFLGDSILDSVITQYLYLKLPTKDEGILTDIRSKMVSRRTLNKLAKEFKIDQFVQTNLGGKVPSSILGNAFEALIAAIYLDKGELFCRTFIVKEIIIKHFSLEDLEKKISSYKKHFIHWTQKNSKEYYFKLLNETGESHKKSFEIALILDKKTISKSIASSKKKAEEMAAEIACETLSI
jgi:ribonuclease-3